MATRTELAPPTEVKVTDFVHRFQIMNGHIHSSMGKLIGYTTHVCGGGIYNLKCKLNNNPATTESGYQNAISRLTRKYGT